MKRNTENEEKRKDKPETELFEFTIKVYQLI